MDTTELTRAFRHATENLEPRPGFTTAVVRGSRRRKTRRRILIATAAATVTAVAGTGTYVLWPDPVPSTQLADPRLTQPTRGDLAGDRAFVNDASRAWRDGLAHSWNADRGIFEDLRGQPHVYWAGNTPAGPAAVVMQEAYLHRHGNLSPSDAEQVKTLVGLVAKDPADGVLKLVGDQFQSKNGPEPGLFRFGPEDRTVLVVDRGIPLFFSAAPRVAQDGRITRDWQQVPLTDGVAIRQVPDGADPDDLRMLARPAKPTPDDKDFNGFLPLERASEYLAFAKSGQFPSASGPTADNRLPWSDTIRVGRPYRNAPDDLMGFWLEQLERAGVTDIGTTSQAFGRWHVVAGLDDGRAVLVSELQEDTKPSRIFAVLLKPDGSVDGVLAGDQVDKAAALPVKLRMPDGQGWVVTDYGAALSYRVSADGQPRDAGRDAALLPDDATQVQVTRGTAKTVVALPH